MIMLLGQLTIPAEIVAIVGAALAGGMAWQIKAVIELKERVTALTVRLEEHLKHCASGPPGL